MRALPSLLPARCLQDDGSGEASEPWGLGSGGSPTMQGICVGGAPDSYGPGPSHPSLLSPRQQQQQQPQPTEQLDWQQLHAALASLLPHQQQAPPPPPLPQHQHQHQHQQQDRHQQAVAQAAMEGGSHLVETSPSLRALLGSLAEGSGLQLPLQHSQLSSYSTLAQQPAQQLQKPAQQPQQPQEPAQPPQQPPQLTQQKGQATAVVQHLRHLMLQRQRQRQQPPQQQHQQPQQLQQQQPQQQQLLQHEHQQPHLQQPQQPQQQGSDGWGASDGEEGDGDYGRLSDFDAPPPQGQVVAAQQHRDKPAAERQQHSEGPAKRLRMDGPPQQATQAGDGAAAVGPGLAGAQPQAVQAEAAAPAAMQGAPAGGPTQQLQLELQLVEALPDLSQTAALLRQAAGQLQAHLQAQHLLRCSNASLSGVCQLQGVNAGAPCLPHSSFRMLFALAAATHTRQPCAPALTVTVCAGAGVCPPAAELAALCTNTLLSLLGSTGGAS